jgi:hypothetical protein
MGERTFGQAVFGAGARTRGAWGMFHWGSRLINNNWRMEEWKRLGLSYPAARVRPITERNEVNEVTRFVREVGEFLRKAFWCSNL